MSSRRAEASSAERMVTSAVTILSRSGPRGVTVDRVLHESGAPRGSVYHHFPGGRAQILHSAATAAAESMTEMIDTRVRQCAPADSIAQFISFWRNHLQSNDFTLGCPLLAIAVDDGDRADGLNAVVTEAFGSWRTAIATALTEHGVPAPRAASLAGMTVCAVEGAIALSRAAGDTRPLDDVEVELRALLRSVGMR